MFEVATPPAAAPVATPPAAAAAPAAAPPAAPAPAPAKQETLFAPPPAAPATAPAPPAAAPAPGAAPAAPPAAGDPLAWLPEKYRVNGADGKLDLEASSKKMSDGLAAAVARIGTGDLPPKTPDEYKFTPPEAFKDIPFDPELNKSFRERAHKQGLTPAQFEFVMGEYFQLVPSLLDGKAAATAAEARAELQKVWAAPAELDKAMSAAERAVAGAPEGLRDQLKDKYGTDPLFWQFAAHYGMQMAEDKPPGSPPAPAGGNGDIETIMKSEAYRNPKHAEHAAVSARVADALKRRYGEAPLT